MKRVRPILWAWLACWLVACDAATVAATGLPAPGPASRPRAVALGSNSLELLADGAAAAARLRSTLDAATTTVEAEIYEFDRADLADAMVAGLSRGVRVTVIEDPSVA